VDFAEVALACGYAQAFVCDSVAGFAEAFRLALASSGPVLLHARIQPGSLEKLGRPTIAPHEIAQRFRGFLARTGQARTGQAAA
jgi:phosphonopyruvate decarboxylase